ncbi:hypothetical protein PIB30_007935 [Stylosanthes scabra]|uniref:B-like cyclin n=1 Tax=Stylosanthes scabra TaxID=79078 RepID=A0ABU6T5N0_9FABA|nr:hypothetical protein [Stylosanthes scabra]
MPLFSCSDCELLCCEDSSGVLSEEESQECSSESSSSSSSLLSKWTEESIACFMEHESNFVPRLEYLSRFQSRSLDINAREESVAWILKVHAYHGFQPLTGYLSVNYFDRFLDSQQLPQTSGWSLQLLSVACLSLAAKMEEPLVPSVLDLQVEGAKYIFEAPTILRMELLVLTVLDWRLRSVTPLSFLAFFAGKIDSAGTFTAFLISRATQIILSNIQEASFLAYRPSCIGAAAILCAANEIPNWSLVKPENAESWCQGLTKEKIIGCYQLMQELVIHSNLRKPMRSSAPTVQSSFSSLSSSLSFSYSYNNKRRKLNDCLGVNDDEKGNSL